MPTISHEQPGWKDLTVVMLGRTLTEFHGVTWDSSTDDTELYGRGHQPHAIQSGNEKTEGQLVLLQTEFDAFDKSIKQTDPKKSILNVHFDLVMTYAEGNAAVTKIIKGVKVNKHNYGMMQEDKFMKITCDFKALGVETP